MGSENLSKDLRKFERSQVEYPVVLADAKRTIRGHITNLSEGGASIRFESDCSIDENSKLK